MTPEDNRRLPKANSNWAWFLDFDGTLTDIAEAPDKVQLSPRLVPTLEALFNGLGGALAIVTGRQLEQLGALLAPLTLPAAGLHGLERRGIDGRTVHQDVDTSALAPVRDGLARIAGSIDRLILEDKEFSLALHYRGCPEKQQFCLDKVRELVAEASDTLEILPGKMVYEIKPRGMDKGKAVEAFLGEYPFAGRPPLFIGDDVTDEAGFDLCNRLGGTSIRVGTPKTTRAQYCAVTVACLLTWLEVTANEWVHDQSLQGEGAHIG